MGKIALSTVAEHDGGGGSVSLGLTLAYGLRPSSLQLAGVTPLLVRSAGTLLGGGNAPQYNLSLVYPETHS
jgi:hypothetical protein